MKLVIAKVTPDNLKSVGSALEPELYCLAYGDKVGYENGYYYVVGKKNIKYFVSKMMAKVDEVRVYFKDAESIAECNHDEQFLNSLLKLKAE